MTAAEQARKDVEECFAERMELNEWPPDVVKWGLEQQKTLIDSLIARLTPVFERAQERDNLEGFRAAAEKRSHSLRERAEALESQVRHSVNQAAFDIQRERAEHLQSEVEAYRADVSLTITQRDAAEERAERAEVDGREWHELYTAEQDRREAAEADVKRLREALTHILGSYDLLVDDKQEVREALAATERKGDIITMTSDTVCVRLDCENFGKPLAGCPKPEERKPIAPPMPLCRCMCSSCENGQCCAGGSC